MERQLTWMSQVCVQVLIREHHGSPPMKVREREQHWTGEELDREGR